jgi:hypothetical protein
VPGRVLHAASVALEALELLKKADRSSHAGWDRKAAEPVLASIVDSLRLMHPTTTPCIPSPEWAKLLNQLPSPIRGGQDGQTLFRRRAKELLEGMGASSAALIEKIETALNA